MRPLVVVALDNGGAARGDEYTPSYDASRGFGGGADAHFAAIRETLMPWVESHYRVLTGPEHTGFAGSSLGGLMSLYAALEHADRFGRIGAISPSLWWDEGMILDLVDARPKPAVHLWADMGTLEGDGSLDDLHLLRDKLLAKGFIEGEDLVVYEDEGARHNEASWAQRFPQTLEFLFPPAGVPAGSKSAGQWKSGYR
jgi:predicted alpha/beta superfamily hydrolase